MEICYFAGDTPISQAICGMVTSIGTSAYPCRKCHVHKTMILSVLNESQVILRSGDEYAARELSKGIKSIPCVYSYGLMDPIKQTPMDSMHMILEGVCRYQAMNIFDDWMATRRG